MEDRALVSFFPNAELLAGQLAPSSIAMYRRDIAAYLAFASGESLPPESPDTLIAWRDQLVRATALSPHTINRMMSAVRRLVKEAAARHVVDQSINLAFAGVSGVKVKALKNRLKANARTRIAPEDMRRICDAPDQSTLVGARDAALLATLASSGIRASEAATLFLGLVEKRGRGFIVRVRGKTDEDYRDAHLSAEAYRLINAWITRRPVYSPYVFTSFATRAAIPSIEPMSETAVWLIVQKYARQCGMEHIKPHDFRRFIGTQLAAKDIRKAQKALGHKNIETTARHYVLDDLEIGLTDNLY